MYDKNFQYISASMDAQGIFVGTSFYPLEFAFTSKCFGPIHLEVVPEFEELTPLTRELEEHRPRLSGLYKDFYFNCPITEPKRKCVINMKDLPSFIEFLCKESLKFTQETVAVKNRELIEFLKDTSIYWRIFDLNYESMLGYGCPNLYTFREFENCFCDLHAQLPCGELKRCALAKVKFIWNWLNIKSQTFKRLEMFRYDRDSESPQPDSALLMYKATDKLTFDNITDVNKHYTENAKRLQMENMKTGDTVS